MEIFNRGEDPEVNGGLEEVILTTKYGVRKGVGIHAKPAN